MKATRPPTLHVTPGNGSGRLILRSQGRLVIMSVSDVCWIEAERNYLRVHTRERSYLTRARVADVERALDSSTFVRIHRGVIINLGCARSFRPVAGGGYLVEMDQGVELRMSRSYAQSVLSRLLRRDGTGSAGGDHGSIRDVG
jgi:two-component system, LytTR family, response regulator